MAEIDENLEVTRVMGCLNLFSSLQPEKVKLSSFFHTQLLLFSATHIRKIKSMLHQNKSMKSRFKIAVKGLITFTTGPVSAQI